MLAFFLLPCCLPTWGQNFRVLDSLKLKLTKAKQDTACVMLLQRIADVSQNLDMDSSLVYARQGLNLATKLKFPLGKTCCLYQLAYGYYGLGNYPLFYENAKKSLTISEQIGYKAGAARAMGLLGLYYNCISNDSMSIFYYTKALGYFMDMNYKRDAASVLNNMGIFYGVKGNYPLALDYHFKALRLNDELRDQHGCLWGYLYISSIYATQKSFTLALNYATKSKKLGEFLQDKSAVSWGYMLMGDIFLEQKKYSLSMENYMHAMEIATKTQEKAIITTSFKKIGLIYLLEGKYDEALSNFNSSLKLAEETDDKRSVSEILSNIAELLQKQGKWKESVIVGKKALQLAQSLKYPDIIRGAGDILYKIYKQQKDFSNALQYYELSVSANDSMFNLEKLKTIDNLKQNYELEKTKKAIELLEKDKKLANQRAFIFGACLVIVIILALYIISYKQRRSKESRLCHELEMKESKYLLESKQRELTMKAINFAQQEQILSTLQEQFETLSNDHPTLNETISKMKYSIDMYLKNNSFRDFEKYFTEVHPDFYNRIKQNAPDLSQNELRVCALIKLNLNTKQIADITHKTPKSVEVIRTNIRKKLNLNPKDNLFDNISQL